MMRLRATRREMGKAYRAHKKCCVDLTIPSYKLIALYCIECGLKALLMEEYRVDHTEQLPVSASIGHNLVEGLKLLRAPVALFKLKDLGMQTRHDRTPQQDVGATDLHQALRYGIPVNLEVESANEIQKILTWLEGKFA
jgi:hypothetical protein